MARIPLARCPLARKELRWRQQEPYDPREVQPPAPAEAMESGLGASRAQSGVLRRSLRSLDCFERVKGSGAAEGARAAGPWAAGKARGEKTGEFWGDRERSTSAAQLPLWEEDPWGSGCGAVDASLDDGAAAGGGMASCGCNDHGCCMRQRPLCCANAVLDGSGAHGEMEARLEAAGESPSEGGGVSNEPCCGASGDAERLESAGRCKPSAARKVLARFELLAAACPVSSTRGMGGGFSRASILASIATSDRSCARRALTAASLNPA